MKKIKTILTSAALIMLLASCGSTKAPQTSADSYDSEPSAPDTEVSENGEVVEKKAKPVGRQEQKRTTKDFFKDVITFTNKEDYIRYDACSLFTPEFGGIKERKSTILIDVDDLSAGWGSQYAAAYYIVTFDENARAQLKKAAEQYFSDFENKRLQRKGKHTDRAYGRLGYKLAWGATSATTPNYGKGEGYLGYEFVKNSPYFVIYNYPFENDYYERAGDATTRESMTLRYYFTRAQLRTLLDLISEENVLAQISESNMFQTPTYADEYDEY